MLSTFLTVGGRKGKLDFDELGIQEVVEVLNAEETDLNSVLRDFGNRGRGEDPVIHFYEDFLREYDKKLKVQRGVFYTPQPVVSYIVRSVHELLQTEFALADGLADTTTWGAMLKKHPGLKLPPLTDEPGEKRTISPDEPFVQILDPATGTATFLVEVIDVIHRHLSGQWKKGSLAAMPTLPASAAPTAPFEPAAPSEQAGGLTEISRGSSELGERTPPDKDKKRTHPGGVLESPVPLPAPLRGASALRGGPGVSPPANVLQPSGLPAAPRTFAEYWNQYVPAHSSRASTPSS